MACEDENTKSLIQSQIKREVRSLGDVIIVSFDDARYILTIIAVEPTYKATGRKTGSIAITSMLLRKTPSEDYYYPYLMLYTDDRKELEGLCKSIVADIDTSTLEPIRELFQ